MKTIVSSVDMSLKKEEKKPAWGVTTAGGGCTATVQGWTLHQKRRLNGFAPNALMKIEVNGTSISFFHNTHIINIS